MYTLPDESRFFTFPRQEIAVTHSSGRASLALPDTEASPACRSVRTFCVGVGLERARRHSLLLLESGLPIPLLVIVGFAGSLRSDLPPGSLMIAESVRQPGAPQTRHADPGLLRIAQSVSLPDVIIQRGLLATTERVLIRAGEKRTLAEHTGAIAVDMETAAVAQVAEEAGLPWCAVRAITDGVDQDLPLDFNACMDANGKMDLHRIVVATLLQPWKIPGLIRLGQHSSLAARNLAGFLARFLARLPE